MRRKIQVIFQDPYSSLNPRMTVGQIIGEPLHVYELVTANARRAAARVGELLDQVGLRPEMAERYPHQLSGGQRQRVGIARALAMEPSFIVCDEAVSALDVSIQGQIINLLEDLQRRLGLAYLFIAHDLAVVRHISMRVVVMYFGRVMEVADRDTIYREPLHPYTKVLLDAAPIPDPTVEKARAPRLIKGELPSHLAPPTGCVFNTPLPDGQPGMPRGHSAAGRKAAGTLCRLHQGLTSGEQCSDKKRQHREETHEDHETNGAQGHGRGARPRRWRASTSISAEAHAQAPTSSAAAR